MPIVAHGAIGFILNTETHRSAMRTARANWRSPSKKRKSYEMSHNLTLATRGEECLLRQTPTDVTDEICALGTREQQLDRYVAWMTAESNARLPRGYKHNRRKYRYDPAVIQELEYLATSTDRVRSFLNDNPCAKFGRN